MEPGLALRGPVAVLTNVFTVAPGCALSLTISKTYSNPPLLPPPPDPAMNL